MITPKPKTDWLAIKTAYLTSEDSFRKLAERFAVSFHTLAKRAKRERWAYEKATIGDAVATTMATAAIESAMDRGKQVGLTAASLVERIIRETEKWLNRIEARANAGSLDVAELRSLVVAWREIIEVGRESFGLDSDEQHPKTLVQVQCLGVTDIVTDVQAQDEVELPEICD